LLSSNASDVKEFKQDIPPPAEMFRTFTVYITVKKIVEKMKKCHDVAETFVIKVEKKKRGVKVNSNPLIVGN
jgi:hypothetical protein